MHPECKYCDNGFFPRRVEDDLVCSSCGAEWSPVMVEDDDVDDDYNDPLFDQLE